MEDEEREKYYCIGCNEELKGEWAFYCPNEECQRYGLVTQIVNVKRPFLPTAWGVLDIQPAISAGEIFTLNI